MVNPDNDNFSIPSLAVLSVQLPPVGLVVEPQAVSTPLAP